MKKAILTMLMVLFLLLPVTLYAAGSSNTVTEGWVDGMEGGVYVITFTWVADDSDGSVPSAETSGPLNGMILKVVTDPGATAPTDGYAVTLTASEGADVMGGALGDLDTANTEQWFPQAGTDAPRPVYVAGTLTMALTGNSVNDALGTLTVYIKR